MQQVGMETESPRKPLFLFERVELDRDRTYRPVLPPRRGEVLAILFAGALILVVFVRAGVTGEISTLTIMIAVLFFLTALLIAYGNWIERNTWIRMKPGGIVFHKPIREQEWGWGEIDELWCARYREGWSFTIIGDDSHFIFHSEIAMRGGIGGEVRIGFPDGERVAAMVRTAAELTEPELDGDDWVCRSGAPDNPARGL